MPHTPRGLPGAPLAALLRRERSRRRGERSDGTGERHARAGEAERVANSLRVSGIAVS
ncbi:hypothetical protein [Streptomyces wuyuanensis]|uniref:hypothetical protein n=1 Tax=Streptomyces wuyuanensis TaxID=1196353 RepID=UPI003D7310DA